MQLPTTGHMVAVARSATGLQYAVTDDSAGVTAGDYLAARPKGLVVIADYTLLAIPEVLDGVTSEALALLPPRPEWSATRVATAWLSSPHTAASLPLGQLPSLQRIIRTRADLQAAADRQFRAIDAQTTALSERYVAAFRDPSPEGARSQIIPPLLNVLREYPTLEMLREAGVVRLAHAVEALAPGQGSEVMDKLLALRADTAPSRTTPAEELLAANTIPAAIDIFLRLKQQIEDLDRRFYALFRDARATDATTVFDPIQTENGSAQHDEGERYTAQQAIEEIEGLFAKRFREDRNPRWDYERFVALTRGAPSFSAGEKLRVATVGQLLALSVDAYVDAQRLRLEAARLLASSHGPDDGVDDARLAIALTDALTFDPLEHIPQLRAAIGRSAHATPELLAEAAGLYTLVLALFRELDRHPASLERMRELIAAGPESGPARAPADITEFFLAGKQVSLSDEAIEGLRVRAVHSSLSTPYRSYLHFATMYSVFTTKRVEQGMLAWALVLRTKAWQHYNPQFMGMARLIYSHYLASQGEFGQAWRELRSVHTSEVSGAHIIDRVLSGLHALRYQLAAQNYRAALVETSPQGPLSIDFIRERAHWTTAIALMIRGSALAQAGDTKAALVHFARTAELASLTNEWTTVLGFETLEFRAWLESLTPASLPPGMSEAELQGLLSRPILIGKTLPALTQQHRRILSLLVSGRTLVAIAAEMHISPNTLKGHARELYSRLGVANREQAVHAAAAYDLL
ncbi:LuxR C-terminal-related transcriptional regulator [Leucobacter albus]|uniref:LuxR C-terminal-related transcriptional regulator n=1 Tax=Leucobacter albus TaxID=272210 RepID=A0ABW3TQ07_9MICO